MSEALIFINTYTIKEGKVDAYQDAAEDWFAWNEAEHPRLLNHEVYISEDGTQVTNIQIHPDSDSMELQMQLVANRHSQWQEYIDWSTMSIALYGTPSDVLVKELRQIAGSGVPVTIKQLGGGFSRLASA